MLKFYGPNRNKIFVDTVLFHVAEALRTKTISFEVLTQHLQIDDIDERTHAYGMWPVSRSLPPLPVRSELFLLFLQWNKLGTKVDIVRLENAEYVQMTNEIIHSLYQFTEAAGMSLSFNQFHY